MSVKYKLIVAFLLASVLPGLLVVSSFYTQMSKATVDRETAHLVSSASQTMRTIDQSLAQVEGAVLNYSASRSVIAYLQRVRSDDYTDDISTQLISDMASRLDSAMLFLPRFESAYVLPRHGYLPIFRGYNALVSAQRYEEHPLYLDSMQRPDPIFWTVNEEKTRGKLALFVSKGVVDPYTEEVLGVIILQAWLEDLLAEMTAELQLYEALFIVDEKGQALYRHGEWLDDETLIAVLREVPETAGGSVTVRSQGREIVASYRQSSTNPWRIYHAVPLSEMTKDLQSVARFAWIYAGIFAAFALIAAVYARQLLYRPLLLLTNRMRGVDDGKLDLELEYDKKDEFSTLIRAYNTLIGRVKKLLADVREHEKRKTELTIQTLQAQIMPHFLYNTLQSVVALARAKDTGAIVSMTKALIGLLKLSAARRTESYRVKDELHHLDSYMTIMNYRYDEPVGVEYDISPGAQELPILRFTLQPLAENSIMHAFDGTGRPPRISVRAALEDGFVVLEVSDNGVGISPPQLDALRAQQPGDAPSSDKRQSMTGIGLANIRERYAMAYGTEAKLELFSEPGQGASVKLRYPATLPPGSE